MTTAAIAYNATSAVIKAAIDAAILANTITVAGGPINTTRDDLTYTGIRRYVRHGHGINDLAHRWHDPLAMAVMTTTAGVGEGFIAVPSTAWARGQNPCGSVARAFRWNGTAWAAAAEVALQTTPVRGRQGPSPVLMRRSRLRPRC